jgi:hypothetical protein
MIDAKQLLNHTTLNTTIGYTFGMSRFYEATCSRMLQECIYRTKESSEETNELKLYSTFKTAKLMGIGSAKLKTLIDKGKIAVVKIEGNIRIPHSEIVNFIEANKVYYQDLSLSKEVLSRNNSNSSYTSSVEMLQEIISKNSTEN